MTVVVSLYTAMLAANERIWVTSRLVVVPVTVTDTKGRAILGLDREHFQITEDSEVREIVSLTRQDGVAALGVVLDLSGSMRPAASQALEAARAITATAEEGDEAFLITFSDRPQLRVALTRDLRALDNEQSFVDPRSLAALQAAALERLKQFEFGLRKQADGSAEQLSLSGSDEVPAGFRTAIEEYYRSLARRPAR